MLDLDSSVKTANLGPERKFHSRISPMTWSVVPDNYAVWLNPFTRTSQDVGGYKSVCCIHTEVTAEARPGWGMLADPPPAPSLLKPSAWCLSCWAREEQTMSMFFSTLPTSNAHTSTLSSCHISMVSSLKTKSSITVIVNNNHNYHSLGAYMYRVPC